MVNRDPLMRLHSAAGEALQWLLRLGDDVWLDVDRVTVTPASDLNDELRHSRDVVLSIAVGPGRILARMAPDEVESLMANLALALEQRRAAS